MRTYVFAVGLLGSSLFACATPSTVEGPTTLSEAFTLLERRPGEKQRRELERVLVDYESEIVVVPDMGVLAPLTGNARSTEASAEMRSIQERLAAIESTLEPAMRLIAEHEGESQAFYSAERAEGMALQEDDAWRSIATKELAIVTALGALARTHVSVTELQGRWDLVEDPEAIGLSEPVIDAANDKADELYASMSPQSGVFEPAVITRVANDLSSAFRQDLALLEQLVDEAGIRLEMEATLLRGDGRLPISIDPYVHVEGAGRGQKSKRVGIPNQQDLERVKREYDAYAKLAVSLNELRERARDAEGLAATRAAVLAALKTFAATLREDLEVELRALIASSELEAIRADAQAMQAELEGLVGTIQDLIDAASGANPVDLASQALAALDLLKAADLAADLRSLAEKLETLLQDLGDDAQVLASRAKAVFLARADQLVLDLQDEPATLAVGSTVAALRKLATMAKLPAFAALEPGAITSRSFELTVAPPGIVNLADTLAEPGDVLELRQKVTVGTSPSAPGVPAGANPAAQQSPVPTEESTEHHAARHLDVRKYGLYSSFGAQILFYDRLHDGSRTYAAAPGVCYNLHYRPDHWTTFFEVVAPGLGFSVSAPSFEDGTELAVGVQLTFLNDLLQVGFARNLSVDDDPEMFYFGFDLIEAFQAAQ